MSNLGRAVGVAVCASTLTWLTVDAGRLFAQKAAAGPATPAAVAAYSFDLVREYARPGDAYTQGFAFHGGRLYEGTGLYGESVLRETVLEQGVQKVVRSRPLPARQAVLPRQKGFQAQHLARLGYPPSEIREQQTEGLVFGEGVTVKNGRIYQLTWVEGICFVWDISNWNTPAKIFNYDGEGWGLTHDGTNLIMSDGSAALAFRDPNTFRIVRTLAVFDPRTRAPVTQLNELEYIDGKIYANIYQSRRIAIIDPKSGAVEGYVLFDGQEFPPGHGPLPTLMPRAPWREYDMRGEVLNGIARDPDTGRLFVTGKKWPTVYEVKLRKVMGAL